MIRPVFFLSLLFSAPALFAGNLLLNGDFSEGEAHWQRDFRPQANACNITVTNGVLRLERPETAEFCRIYQDLPLEADTYYTLTYRRQGPKGVLSRMLLIQRDQDGNWLGDPPACLTAGSDDWIGGTLTVRTAARVNAGRIDLRVDTPGILQADDLAIRKATAAEIEALQLQQEPDEFVPSVQWQPDSKRNRMTLDVALPGEGERAIEFFWENAPQQYQIHYKTATGWLSGSRILVNNATGSFQSVAPATVTGVRIAVPGKSEPETLPVIQIR